MGRLAAGAAGLLAVLGLMVAAALVPAALAQSSPQERGRAIAQSKCARCHAVGERDGSPLTLAPAFRDLHLRYPIENLAEALAEGIVTGHAAMPQFTFAPDEIDAFLAYLESLAGSPGKR